MGVIEVTEEGLCLTEINPEFSLQEVIDGTDAPLIVAESLKKTAVVNA